MNTKNDSYWSALADNICLFQKGILSLENMQNKYPNLDDSDGYGMEDDTWLLARINKKGEWVRPFQIER